MLIKFEKMHGCGNDFVLINNTETKITLSPQIIKKICDRHYGIGADGLVLIEKEGPDYFMNYYNSDGSLAELCGNAMRCTASFINRHLENKSQFPVLSRSGKIPTEINSDGTVSIELPPARYDPDEIGLAPGYESMADDIIQITFDDNISVSAGCASMGNPHCIIIVPDLLKIPIGKLGPLIEKSRIFINGVNVSFAQIESDEHVRMLTWERGAGLTYACGTGACATASFLRKHNYISSNTITVSMPGGDLLIELGNDKLVMTGPAKTVFAGEIEVNDE